MTAISKYMKTSIPSFEGKKAFVLSGAFYGNVVALFAEAGFEKASSVEDADVVVFIGGVDIDPDLYGQTAIRETQTPSKERDKIEREVYEECVRTKKPMFGICRGAQFLHAMNGGELWQDVNNHAGKSHLIYDQEDHVLVEATSIHHQMLIYNNNMDVVAVCQDQVATRFSTDSMTIDLGKEGTNEFVEMEIEAGKYLDTRCFFVQGHPEVGTDEYRSWCMHKFEDFWLDLEIADEEEEKAEQMKDWQRTAVM